MEVLRLIMRRILALKVEIKANIGAYATGPGAIIACMVGPKV